MIMGVTASTSTGIMMDQFASIQKGKNYYVELDSNGTLAANWGGARDSPKCYGSGRHSCKKTGRYSLFSACEEKKHAPRKAGVLC